MNIDKHDQSKLKVLESKGSVAPYLVGWLLGVPGSVLVVIFLIRGCR